MSDFISKRSVKQPHIGHRSNAIPIEDSMTESLSNDIESSLKTNPNYQSGFEHESVNRLSPSDSNPHAINTIKENIGNVISAKYIVVENENKNENFESNTLKTSNPTFHIEFILFIAILMVAISVICIEYNKYKSRQDYLSAKKIVDVSQAYETLKETGVFS